MRYVGLFDAFTESDADQVYLLQNLEVFGNPSLETRASHFSRLLMAMYEAEIVEPVAVVEWFDSPPCCGESGVLRVEVSDL